MFKDLSRIDKINIAAICISLASIIISVCSLISMNMLIR